MCKPLTEVEYLEFRHRLENVLASENHHKIVEETSYALHVFQMRGFPKDWCDWQRAKDKSTAEIIGASQSLVTVVSS